MLGLELEASSLVVAVGVVGIGATPTRSILFKFRSGLAAETRELLSFLPEEPSHIIIHLFHETRYDDNIILYISLISFPRECGVACSQSPSNSHHHIFLSNYVHSVSQAIFEGNHTYM